MFEKKTIPTSIFFPQENAFPQYSFCSFQAFLTFLRIRPCIKKRIFFWSKLFKHLSE